MKGVLDGFCDEGILGGQKADLCSERFGSIRHLSPLGRASEKLAWSTL